MNDPKSWTGPLATLAIGACAVLLMWKGDTVYGMACLCLLVPNAQQIGGKAPEVKP